MNNFMKRILSAIILIPLALYFIIHGSLMLMFFTAICFLVACYEWHMMTKKKHFRIYGLPFLFFLIILRVFCPMDPVEPKIAIFFLIHLSIQLN